MRKKIVLTVAFAVIMSANNAFAEGQDVVVPTISIPSTVSPVIERAEIISDKSLKKLQARGDKLIKERVNSLNQNATTIANAKGLTADQKSAFAAFFTGKIAELNSLGAKISSSTEASSTKALVNSIYTDFRIYAVVIPQIRIQKRIYEIQNHMTKLSETFTKIQTKIDEEKSKGKEVAIWQKSLDDAKTLVATDTAKLSLLMTQINAMKPSDYPTTSKSIIEGVNSGIKNIARDLNSISKNVHRPILMKVKNAMSATSTTTSSNR